VPLVDALRKLLNLPALRGAMASVGVDRARPTVTSLLPGEREIGLHLFLIDFGG
jgi:hypothetical protein